MLNGMNRSFTRARRYTGNAPQGMPGVGLEPTRSCEQRLLRTQPLPVGLPGRELVKQSAGGVDSHPGALVAQLLRCYVVFDADGAVLRHGSFRSTARSARDRAGRTLSASAKLTRYVPYSSALQSQDPRC